MTGRGTPARGMALVQALIIVAAIAAVATALLLRAETARHRLETRFGADQAALYLDSGIALVRAVVAELPADGLVHRGQDWARPRDGVVIDRGVLAWQIDDLQGRFNVNDLNGDAPPHEAARAAFAALARGQGLSRSDVQRLVQALGPTGDALPLPLVDPRQLAPLMADAHEEFARLLPFIAALPSGTPLNVNTAPPEVFAALLPDLPSTVRRTIERHLSRDPAATIEAFLGWAQQALPADATARLTDMALTTTTDWFTVTIEARLDTLRLHRSVTLSRNGAQGTSAVVLSLPEFD